MVRHREPIIFPAAVFGTLKYYVVAGRRPLDPGIDLVQLLVPPPHVFVPRIPPDALVGHAFPCRGPVPVISAIKHHRQVELFEIGQALGLDCLGFGV